MNTERERVRAVAESCKLLLETVVEQNASSPALGRATRVGVAAKVCVCVCVCVCVVDV
jgi:hypothetical protein